MKPVLPEQRIAAVDENGRLTRPFYDFLREFFRRLGGVSGFTEGFALLGSDEGDPHEVEVWGDATLTDEGALTIGLNKITYAKFQQVNADKLLGRPGTTGNVSEIDCTAAGRALLDDANAAAQRATLGLVIGTDVQAWSANLDEFAAVNPTAAGLTLLDDLDASAQRTTLGLVIGTDVQAHSANTLARAATAGFSGTLTFDATNPGSVTSLTVSNGLITARTTL